MEVVILTKSSKHKGYCVSGIDINSGQWVRLVSDDEKSHGALFDRDMRYEDGTCCEILDSVQVPIIQKTPIAHQTENILIDNTFLWEKTNRLTLRDVLKIHPVEKHTQIFGNPHHKVSEEEITSIRYSLALVKVRDLVIDTTPNYNDQLKTKASFIYNSCRYTNISVTDPDFYNKHVGIERAVIVVSLPEAPWGREYYKYIAIIFPLHKEN